MSKSITPLTLRLPERLKEDLEICAQRNDRSINKELAARLRKSFETEFSHQMIERLNQELPTAGNDCTLGIRLPLELKETCTQSAYRHQTSLNQEIVLRLQATKNQSMSDSYIVNSPKASVDIVTEGPSRHSTFVMMELYNKLSDKNKEVVIKLIKALSD